MHFSVLLEETIANLITSKEGVSYLDCTFGRGGHSKRILEEIGKSSKLLAIDKDSEAIEVADKLAAQDNRFFCYKKGFKDLDKIDYPLPLMGILFDLGVSSPQLDDASRGFSFQKDALLDMRMDRDIPYSAYDFVNKEKQAIMEKVLFEYGEEKFTKRIVRAILEYRATKPIETTLELVEIIKKAVPKIEPNKNPATRTFQAIRIYVNQELEEFKMALEKAYQKLDVGGRIAVITFHSLEDKMFKEFVRNKINSDLPLNIPIMPTPKLKIIYNKIMPSKEELDINTRSRSAKLRIVEKLC